ncbi:glycosyltransferase [Eubacterium oxidoreducens]|uniref:Glycosyltransferase involved in cell wall bisynthesis n=1 Tax=Eubacterium oxidoreducens TaxID=1732 RepID=A0A1G6AEK0_EUBOX|nr:glycosyltransferase [Eubacterium oxidoreducens]SDB06802.1 Glycosyltransferase involved in cell wall bisynthesis [Eubacterium oxidoreducens]
MKKIAFYVESMVVGGAEKILIDLANSLDPKEYEITVIAIFKNSVYDGYTFRFESFFKPHVKYQYLVDNTNKLKYRMFNHSYASKDKQKIYRKLVKEKYDIEVAFYEGMPTEFVAHSTNPDAKKYAWLHTDNHRLYSNRPKEYIEAQRKLYEKYDCVVGVSEQVTQSFENYFPGIKTTTIYNIVDDEMIREKSQQEIDLPPKDEMTLLTVGRLVEVKGYDRLITSLGLIKKKGYRFHLYMIGEGEEREKLSQLIEENDLTEEVTMLGLLQNPYAYMKKADYLVITSYAEGFSTVAVEALLCELPILTTDCAGMKEIFGESECGIICENSKQGILDMLLACLKHPEKVEDYKKECQNRRSFFEHGIRVRAYEDLWSI